MATMEVIPTGKALGAEIRGIDLSKEVSDADRKFIFNAYIENLVLLFRGQSLSFDDLLRLREVFGKAGLTANQLEMLVQALDYEQQGDAPAEALATFWRSAAARIETAAGREIERALRGARGRGAGNDGPSS